MSCPGKVAERTSQVTLPTSFANVAEHARTLRRVATTRTPTRWGEFLAIGYQQESCNGTRWIETAVALVLGETTVNLPLLRIHSQCLTGDVLGSLRCDCGEQPQLAMQAIASEGCGLLIYEQQEGRGIGLMAKLQAYGLQDRGLDTVKADHVLGLHSDYRDFALPIAILRDLGISGVRLLSNNPQKSHLLRDAGVEVVDHISCEAAPNPHSVAYLRAKKEKLGHTLTASVHSTKEPVSYSSTNRLCSRDERKDASASDRSVFASVEGAIRELRVGRMIVVVDDESRENEGDLMIAAEMVTPEAINFMTTYRRGLICLAMTGIRLDELELPLMVSNSTSLMDTSFTISIDAKGRGVTTGISANDRAETVLAAIDPQSRPHDFSRPGHIFPLKSREGGVLERRGHTEAAVDLARLAGLNPAAVI